MKRANKRTKRTLDFFHYVTSVGWLGVGLCQLTLNVIALSSDEPSLRHAAHAITHIFDRALLIALGTGSLVSGALLGLKTKWGLVRYWWVLTKLLLTVAALVFGGVWMGGWIGEAVARSVTPSGLSDPAYLALRNQLMTGSVSTVLTLLLMTLLSVSKPWGRSWFGRRPGSGGVIDSEGNSAELRELVGGLAPPPSELTAARAGVRVSPSEARHASSRRRSQSRSCATHDREAALRPAGPLLLRKISTEPGAGTSSSTGCCVATSLASHSRSPSGTHGRRPRDDQDREGGAL